MHFRESATKGTRHNEDLIKKPQSCMPVVTIITVVFNDHKNIEQTIKNITNQTYHNVEYIIIDGGSTDGTLEVIKKYSHVIDCWISEPDLGIYDAMNKGIRMAAGEWINFMNSGDLFYSPQTIEDIITRCPDSVDVIYGDHEVRYLNDKNHYSRIQKAREIKHIWKGMFCSHQSLFIKTKLMRKYEFNINNWLGADYELLYEVYEKKHTFYYSGEIISSISSHGLSDVHRAKSISSHWRIAKKHSSNAFIDIYYFIKILNSLYKTMIKKMLPSGLIIQIIKYKNMINTIYVL